MWPQMNLLIAKFTSTFEGMKARADLNAAKVFARFLLSPLAEKLVPAPFDLINISVEVIWRHLRPLLVRCGCAGAISDAETSGQAAEGGRGGTFLLDGTGAFSHGDRRMMRDFVVRLWIKPEHGGLWPEAVVDWVRIHESSETRIQQRVDRLAD